VLSNPGDGLSLRAASHHGNVLFPAIDGGEKYFPFKPRERTELISIFSIIFIVFSRSEGP